MKMLVEITDYNAKVNAALVAILSALPAAELAADRKVYYKSLLGTFQHLAMAEFTWLARLRELAPAPALSASALLARESDELRAESGASLAACAALSAEVDGLFAAYAAGLDEAGLEKRISYTAMSGEKLERSVRHIVFHVMNHGTHHRGEISAMLDQAGVKNDFSGFNRYNG